MKAHFSQRHATASGEDNPFWISYSDLMTAAMIIFMTIMAITMALIGKTAPALAGTYRTLAGADVMRDIELASKRYPGIAVDVKTGVIDIGELVRFGRGQAGVSAEAGATLREFVKEVLAQRTATTKAGHIKNIVVEGYADQDGAYLYNLSLSLNRSRNVVCALLDTSAQTAVLDEGDKNTLRQLLMVGGFSSNGLRESKESSRRVEMKFVFASANEAPLPARPAANPTELGSCNKA